LLSGAASDNFAVRLHERLKFEFVWPVPKGLLDRTIRARYPDLTHGGLTFKKAKKEKTEEQLTLGDDVPFDFL
jgi:hypothetical protein